MDDALARKEEEIQRLRHEIAALSEHRREGDLVKSDLNKCCPPLPPPDPPLQQSLR